MANRVIIICSRQQCRNLYILLRVRDLYQRRIAALPTNISAAALATHFMLHACSRACTGSTWS
jgi:hypothetical protein